MKSDLILFIWGAGELKKSLNLKLVILDKTLLPLCKFISI